MFLPMTGVLANIYWQILIFTFQATFGLVLANQSEILKVIFYLKIKVNKFKMSFRNGENELEAVENIMNIQQMLLFELIFERANWLRSP